MHARSYTMNYSYYYVFLRNYTYTERFTESMRSKDTSGISMENGISVWIWIQVVLSRDLCSSRQSLAQLQLSRRKAW